MSIAVSCQTAAAGAFEPADVEAVDPDQLARPIDVEVALRAWVARRLVGRGVAGDQREPLGAGVEAVAAEHLPDAVWRDDDRPPLLAPELGRDALGPEARMSDREADDPFLDHLRQLVGHLRPAPLPRPEHLKPVAIDLALPRVVGRAVNTEAPARLRNAGAGGLGEQLQAIAEQHVILGHQAHSFSHLAVKKAA